jgi:hypothetical protein
MVQLAPLRVARMKDKGDKDPSQIDGGDSDDAMDE